jgi:hypothetical protein
MFFSSPSNRRLLFLAIAVVGAVAIFLRGNYLLGSQYGSICAAVMLALVWLLARALDVEESASRLRLVLVLLIGIAASFSLAFPASVNGHVQHLIEMQAIDRQAHRELLALFGSEPAFRDLTVSSAQLKGLSVTIHGSVPARNDFDRLRSRLSDECPIVEGCFLQWDIVLRDSQVRIDGTERPKSAKPQT